MMRLADLEGRWQISRTIEDRRADLTGVFEGEATWSPDAEGLIQTEVGTLRYGNATPMQATRRYLWREQDGALRVFFEDGHAFHTVPLEGEEALHDCPPDTYRVRYTVETRGRFATRWHVTGPRKDAVLQTRFTKV